MKTKASSIRSKREIENLYRETFEGIKKGIQSINNALDQGKGLSDEQYRFLKNTPKIIETLQERELAKESKQEGLPEGKLREYVERVWRLNKIGKLEDVIEATGYYRCTNCGELHPKDRSCMYNEYIDIKKINIEDLEEFPESNEES